MSRRVITSAVFLAGLPLLVGAAGSDWVQAVSAAAAAGGASTQGGKEPLLDEVLVQGTRRWKMRQEMIQVEDKFYGLYNELNKDKDFDVHCHIEAPPDRIIKERVCRVAFYENAQAVEAVALLDGHSAPPADMVAQAREVDFEKHFLQVVNSDPRLLKLVREREALGKKFDKYEEERAQRSALYRWLRPDK